MNRTFLKMMCAFAILSSPFYLTSQLSAGYVYQNHFLPPYQHFLFSTQTDGQMIEIDDGSIWKINYYHAYLVRYWHPNDVLEISQTEKSYGDRFWITNKTQGGYVSAELSSGPIMNHPYTNYLSYVDRGIAALLNSSGFESRYLIDTRDAHLLSHWQANDPIIVGKNNTSWFSFFEKSDVILINVTQNNYVRATLL